MHVRAEMERQARMLLEYVQHALDNKQFTDAKQYLLSAGALIDTLENDSVPTQTI